MVFAASTTLLLCILLYLYISCWNEMVFRFIYAPKLWKTLEYRSVDFFRYLMGAKRKNSSNNRKSVYYVTEFNCTCVHFATCSACHCILFFFHLFTMLVFHIRKTDAHLVINNTQITRKITIFGNCLWPLLASSNGNFHSSLSIIHSNLNLYV